MNNIQSFLQQQVEDHKTPSIQYAFFDANTIQFEMKQGERNLASHSPVDSNTTYHLYSITKTFTALAVLQLAASRKIELDRPVSDYLAAFIYDHRITIRQLLSHTGGIPNPMPLKWIHPAGEHSSFDRDQFFASVFAAHPKLDFAPGSKFKYSNLGYVFLGQLIEHVSGQSYETYIGQNILAPCGIDSTDLTFTLDPERHATGYHKFWSITNLVLSFLIDKKTYMGPREGKWKPFKPFYNNGIAYGGLFGTATGLRQYGQALLKKESVLLNDQLKQLLFTETSINKQPTGMSLSWFTGSLKGHRYVAHAGGGGGYYVELRLYPDLAMGSLIMYNRSGMRDERMLDRTDGNFISSYVF